ncbi:Peroxisomal membrane protein 2 [Durusdinium trenchii]|uniref:Peroxisomal membrane protein 2 n=1 Tax=Durusdinium trenchii TaxID=1381693 RepID=A0ABP0S2J6_9DINO
MATFPKSSSAPPSWSIAPRLSRDFENTSKNKIEAPTLRKKTRRTEHGDRQNGLERQFKWKTCGNLSKWRSPLRCPPPWNKPLTDKWGFPKSLESLPPAEPWDVRHHLQGMPNDVMPKEQRAYFSKPQSTVELQAELTKNPSCSSMLKRIEAGDLPGRPRSIISCDAGAPVCPQRHVFGGTMLDRDGFGRTWNNRWQTGIAILNEHCHPDHRTYFTQRSIFERSPSQIYRRFLHQERRPGEWVSIDQRRPARFPPLGGLLTGRSGTPVPGATP